MRPALLEMVREYKELSDFGGTKNSADDGVYLLIKASESLATSKQSSHLPQNKPIKHNIFISADLLGDGLNDEFNTFIRHSWWDDKSMNDIVEVCVGSRNSCKSESAVYTSLVNAGGNFERGKVIEYFLRAGSFGTPPSPPGIPMPLRFIGTVSYGIENEGSSGIKNFILGGPAKPGDIFRFGSMGRKDLSLSRKSILKAVLFLAPSSQILELNDEVVESDYLGLKTYNFNKIGEPNPEKDSFLYPLKLKRSEVEKLITDLKKSSFHNIQLLENYGYLEFTIDEQSKYVVRIYPGYLEFSMRFAANIESLDSISSALNEIFDYVYSYLTPGAIEGLPAGIMAFDQIYPDFYFLESEDVDIAQRLFDQYDKRSDLKEQGDYGIGRYLFNGGTFFLKGESPLFNLRILASPLKDNSFYQLVTGDPTLLRKRLLRFDLFLRVYLLKLKNELDSLNVNNLEEPITTLQNQNGLKNEEKISRLYKSYRQERSSWNRLLRYAELANENIKLINKVFKSQKTQGSDMWDRDFIKEALYYEARSKDSKAELEYLMGYLRRQLRRRRAELRFADAAFNNVYNSSVSLLSMRKTIRASWWVAFFTILFSLAAPRIWEKISQPVSRISKKFLLYIFKFFPAKDKQTSVLNIAEPILVGISPEGQEFVIEGIDVWQYEWITLKEHVQVKDPVYGQNFLFPIYEIYNNDQIIRFAAGEFANGMFGFYLYKLVPSS